MSAVPVYLPRRRPFAARADPSAFGRFVQGRSWLLCASIHVREFLHPADNRRYAIDAIERLLQRLRNLRFRILPTGFLACRFGSFERLLDWQPDRKSVV